MTENNKESIKVGDIFIVKGSSRKAGGYIMIVVDNKETEPFCSGHLLHLIANPNPDTDGSGWSSKYRKRFFYKSFLMKKVEMSFSNACNITRL